MSSITNVILTFSTCEDSRRICDQVTHLTKGLQAFPDMSPFLDLSEMHVDRKTGDWSPAGSKALETPLLIGALNYLEWDEFLKAIRIIHFDHPQEVQIIVRFDHADKYELFEPFANPDTAV